MTIRQICERLGRAITATEIEVDAPHRGMCLMCGEPVRASRHGAFTGEHVHCYVGQLRPAGRRSPAPTTEMPDRRRHLRFPATWRLRFWFGDLGYTEARAENASLSGLGITLSATTTAASLLKPGRTVGLEVFDGGEPVFRTTVEVRHRAGTTVGVEFTEGLPAELIEGLETS